MARVVVTGVTGQDGSYMAEALLARGDDVIGVTRDISAARNCVNLSAIARGAESSATAGFTLVDVALDDAESVARFIASTAPDCVFHLAGKSFVGGDGEDHSFHVASTLAILSALATHAPRARFVLAGSAAQRAGASEVPQSERTAPAPTSTYGLAKQLASEAVAWFRATRGMHAATALLYNHESPRRGARFVTKKIAVAAARIARGLEKNVELGDVKAVRDWGWAPEYVAAMLQMTELAAPEDLVIATGTGRTVADFADAAFRAAGLSAKDHVVIRGDLVRAAEPIALIGDASRAHAVLGWRAQTSFDDVAARMVTAELALIDEERAAGRVATGGRA